MPFDVKNGFSARLSARGYTEDAWNAAAAWLESTDWFRLRGRYLGQHEPTRGLRSRKSGPGG